MLQAGLALFVPDAGERAGCLRDFPNGANSRGACTRILLRCTPVILFFFSLEYQLQLLLDYINEFSTGIFSLL
jgi:hypothetical protein